MGTRFSAIYYLAVNHQYENNYGKRGSGASAQSLFYGSGGGRLWCQYPVLRKWLEPYISEIGKQKGSSLTLEQVVLIVEKIGPPFYTIVAGDERSASGCK